MEGAPPPPSPLTGCYLLVVIAEPHSKADKDIILQRIAKGLLSWDNENCHVDLEKELQAITSVAPEGEEARHGERLIQFASENLVTEVLIHPAANTLIQCMKNLLSSFTRHRHIIYAGYTFGGNGSWALQDGTFSLADFSEAFQENEVQRVIRAYENTITIDIHCSSEGDWSKLPKEPFTKLCKVQINPNDVLTSGSPSINNFLNYLSPFLVPSDIETLLESSDVVGNIRFSHPTLYVFPGGQGDAALFGINGFNMLVDGGFARKACFWDFTRHLDRLDAILLTRLNNSNVCGISSVLRRKTSAQVYPQVGHFFCNLQERKAISPDGDKDKDPLLINLLEEGHNIVLNLRHLNLRPQPCYRDSDPINLYHKVGHGTLDMYVLSPVKDSREVKEFLQKWNSNDQKLFTTKTSRDFPLPNLVSICALLVWQPANPSDTITRLLFPGSTPQHKVFEGLDRLKHLEFMKHPVCTAKQLTPSGSILGLSKTKQIKASTVLEKIFPEQKSQRIIDNKPIKEKTPLNENKQKIENKNENKKLENGEIKVIKSDSVESDKSESKSEPKKTEINGKDVEIILEDKSDTKAKKLELRKQRAQPKPRSESANRKSKQKIDKKESKPSPPTPKKTAESKMNGVKEKPKSINKLTSKSSPSATPAKSTKDANNRKVVESKFKPAPKKESKDNTKPASEKKEVKIERKPISRRPKAASPARTGKVPASPSKISGIRDKNGVSRTIKLDKEGTTDSSAVSTPSADQDTKKIDVSKLSKTELEDLKAKELADLKEEQEVVKEIEAVFRKDEKLKEEEPDLRKIEDVSIGDKTAEVDEEEEEYLIVEKEEVEQNTDSVNEQESANKEDEIQKHQRDSEESEKPRKERDVGKSFKTVEEPKLIETETCKVLEIVQPAKDGEEVEIAVIPEMARSKEDSRDKTEEMSKEISMTSPEDKIDVSSEKKLTDTRDVEEEENKEAQDQQFVQESHPDEKFSATIESGATTAPTLPEDERIPLDEIKEDQVIEEKYVKEETKEKEVPTVIIPQKTFEPAAKISPIIGMKFDAHHSHIRDIVKTPDEVADLPVHEEVDIDTYDFPSAYKKDDKTKKEVEESKTTKEEPKKSESFFSSIKEAVMETIGDVKDIVRGKSDITQEKVEKNIEDVTEEIEKAEVKKEKIEEEIGNLRTEIELAKETVKEQTEKIKQDTKEAESKLEGRIDDKEIIIEDEIVDIKVEIATSAEKLEETHGKMDEVDDNERIVAKIEESVKQAIDVLKESGEVLQDKIENITEVTAEIKVDTVTKIEEIMEEAENAVQKIEYAVEETNSAIKKSRETIQEKIKDPEENADVTEKLLDMKDQITHRVEESKKETIAITDVEQAIEEKSDDLKQAAEDIKTQKIDDEKEAIHEKVKIVIDETKHTAEEKLGEIEQINDQIKETAGSTITEIEEKAEGGIEDLGRETNKLEQMVKDDIEVAETTVHETKVELEKKIEEQKEKTLDLIEKTEKTKKDVKEEVDEMKNELQDKIENLKEVDNTEDKVDEKIDIIEDIIEKSGDIEDKIKYSKQAQEKIEDSIETTKDKIESKIGEIKTLNKISDMIEDKTEEKSEKSEEIEEDSIEKAAAIVDLAQLRSDRFVEDKGTIESDVKITISEERTTVEEESKEKEDEIKNEDIETDFELKLEPMEEKNNQGEEKLSEGIKIGTEQKVVGEIAQEVITSSVEASKEAIGEKIEDLKSEISDELDNLKHLDEKIADKVETSLQEELVCSRKDNIDKSEENGDTSAVISDGKELLSDIGQQTECKISETEAAIELPLRHITEKEEGEKEEIEDDYYPVDPKVREEDVLRIVSNVAHVLKSDAPLEELTSNLPLVGSPFKSFPLKGITTELRETHITTLDSPIREETDLPEMKEALCLRQLSATLVEEERKIALEDIPPQEEEPKKESPQEKKISDLIKDSNALIASTSKIISEIKSKDDKKDEEDETVKSVATVHRMLVTASSEDGGEETVICPTGSITFIKADQSGKSSPELTSGQSTPEVDVKKSSESMEKPVSGKASPEEFEKSIPDVRSTDVNISGKSSPDLHGIATPGSRKESIDVQSSTPDKSGKTTPDIQVSDSRKASAVIEDDKKSEKSTPDTPGSRKESIDIQYSCPEKSGKTSPDVQASDSRKASVVIEDDKKSGKSTPDIPGSRKESIDIQSFCPEKSGKTSPDVQAPDSRKASVVIEDDKKSGKSTPDIPGSRKESIDIHSSCPEKSGKTSPDVQASDSRKASGVIEDDKKSGKSTPDIPGSRKESIDIHFCPEKSDKTSPDVQASDSRKASAVIEDDRKSGKSTPDIPESRKESIDIQSSCPEKSGKTSPDVQASNRRKASAVIEDDKKSGKSTPDIPGSRKESIDIQSSCTEKSGKTSPDVLASESRKASAVIEDDKKSGKSTSNIPGSRKESIDIQSYSPEKSGKTSPSVQESGSRKSSVVVEDSEKSGKASPGISESRKESIDVQSSPSEKSGKTSPDVQASDSRKVGEAIEDDEESREDTPEISGSRKESIDIQLSTPEKSGRTTPEIQIPDGRNASVDKKYDEQSGKTTPDVPGNGKISVDKLVSIPHKSGKTSPEIQAADNRKTSVIIGDVNQSEKDSPDIPGSCKEIIDVQSTPEKSLPKIQAAHDKKTRDIIEDDKHSGKSTPDIFGSRKENIDVQSTIKRVTHEIQMLDSGTTSIMNGEDKQSEKDIPDISGIRKENIVDKISPEIPSSVGSTTDEKSGKTTPEIQVLDSEAIKDEKSTPNKSGKAPPDIPIQESRKESLDIRKDELSTSGKSTPDIKDEKSEKITPEEKVTSGKATPDIIESRKSSIMSDLSTTKRDSRFEDDIIQELEKRPDIKIDFKAETEKISPDTKDSISETSTKEDVDTVKEISPVSADKVVLDIEEDKKEMESVEKTTKEDKSMPVEIEELTTSKQSSGKSTPDIRGDKPEEKSDLEKEVSEMVLSDIEEAKICVLQDGKIETIKSIESKEDKLAQPEKLSPEIKEEIKEDKDGPPEKEEKLEESEILSAIIKISEKDKVSSGEASPDISESKKGSLEIQYSSSPSPSSRDFKDLSRKTTPDLSDRKISELRNELTDLSGISTPELKYDLDDGLSGKSSPNLQAELASLKSSESGKSTPQPTGDICRMKISDVRSISGVSTPDMKHEDDKSGKSSPVVLAEVKDLKESASEKSTSDLNHDLVDAKSVISTSASVPHLKSPSDVKHDLDTNLGKSDSIKSPEVEDFDKSSSDFKHVAEEVKLEQTADITGKPEESISAPVPEFKEVKDSESGKSTPDIANLSGNSTTAPIPELGKINVTEPEKITPDSNPDLEDIKFRKSSPASVPEVEKMKGTESGKSTPNIAEKSGKSTPSSVPESKELKGAESGKSTPDLRPYSQDMKSGKSTPELPQKFKSVGSGKSTPDSAGKFPLYDIKQETASPDIKDLKEEAAREMSDIKHEDLKTSLKEKESVIETLVNGKLSPELSKSEVASPLSREIEKVEQKMSVINEFKSFKDETKCSVEIKTAISEIEQTSSGKSTPDIKSGKSTSDITIQKTEKTDLVITEVKTETKQSTPNVIIERSTPDIPEEIQEVKITEGESSSQPILIIEKSDLSIAGPSHVKMDDSISSSGQISPLNKEIPHLSSEDLHLSGKSTPDIADVERMKEIHEILKHEKHIPGSSTPPTVPVSPIVKETFTLQEEKVKEIQKEKEIIEEKESKERCQTPGSDDDEMGGVSSPHSDISSGQMSRVAHAWGQGSSEERQVSDDDDIPGSPNSVTSQMAHSPPYESEYLPKIGKMDPMNTSFYGVLPDEAETIKASSQPIPISGKGHYEVTEKKFIDEADLDFDKAMLEHRQTRGSDLVGDRYTKTVEQGVTNGRDQIPMKEIKKNGFEDQASGSAPTAGKSDSPKKVSPEMMTSSFIEPTTSTPPAKDPIESWGKPLGLPSPALPPSSDLSNKTTPKKIPPSATLAAKNKINDERKRSDSPSKYDKKNKKMTPVYMDLTYVPHHGNSNYSYIDFFKRIRARYYVFSGTEPSREVYNALLEAKQTWEDKDLEVTIIPTYDTDVLGYWVAENEDLLAKYKIDLSPSASRCTINLQDHETSCSAYRLEF